MLCRYARCRNGECRGLFKIMRSVVMLNVNVLNVIAPVKLDNLTLLYLVSFKDLN